MGVNSRSLSAARANQTAESEIWTRYIESLNSRSREEFLERNYYNDLNEVIKRSEGWKDYSKRRHPQTARGKLLPSGYTGRIAPPVSKLEVAATTSGIPKNYHKNCAKIRGA